jgi:plastocyanin
MIGEVRVVPGNATGGNNTTAPLEHKVLANQGAFTPRNLSISATESVNWTNPGTGTHNVLFEDPAIGTVGELPPGASVKHTFNDQGTFRYRCTYHSTSFTTGMVGKIQVGPPPTSPVPGAPIVEIDTPTDGATVSGDVNVTGTVETTPGSETNVVVEVRIGDGDNNSWEEAEVLVSDNSNITWWFEWKSQSTPDGNITIYARARAGTVLSSIDERDVIVDNTETAEGGGKKQPGFEFVALGVAACAAIAVARRRRS